LATFSLATGLHLMFSVADSGMGMAAEIKKIRSDIPIVICTGFSERINQENAEAIGLDGFLMKPITQFDLAAMVWKVLGPSPKDSGPSAH